MRTHLADVMLIVAKSALNNEPFKVTTEHIIDLAPEYPEADPDDVDDKEADDEDAERKFNEMMHHIFGDML